MTRSAAISIDAYICALADSPLAPWARAAPWELPNQASTIVNRILQSLPETDYLACGVGIAIHRSAVVESGAVLKGPLVIGPDCFVAAGATLRGGNWIAERCTLGPGSELKSSFIFGGTKLAHFNFVGDSILGSDINLEAGSIICNYRNERSDKEILVWDGTTLLRTGCEKFGALVGDGSRLGANAVVAPGALLRPGTVVGRGTSLDQEAESGPV